MHNTYTAASTEKPLPAGEDQLIKSALIILVRNPVLGMVKTRLAATMGKEKALQVYTRLLAHTKNITQNLPVTNFVFYADEINNKDLWAGYEKRLQHGTNLGERMANALREVFNEGYQNICIIGSDCYDLNEAILSSAFEKLHSHDVLIGPAADGGYYLIGMRFFFKNLFDGITWSSSSVLAETLKKVQQQNLSVHLLPVLNDVDEEKDITFNI
jgi:uncharacterized protein